MNSLIADRYASERLPLVPAAYCDADATKSSTQSFWRYVVVCGLVLFALISRVRLVRLAELQAFEHSLRVVIVRISFNDRRL